jgi:hypothetical protein
MSHNYITINLVTAIDLVQQGYEVALQTHNDSLKDDCVSLQSAVICHDIKERRAKIRRVPHEAQINRIREAIQRNKSVRSEHDGTGTG